MPVGLNLGISKDILTVRKSGLIAWDEEPDWRMGKDCPSVHGERPNARAQPSGRNVSFTFNSRQSGCQESRHRSPIRKNKVYNCEFVPLSNV